MSAEPVVPEPFGVRVLSDDEGILVAVRGELDLHTGPQLVSALCEALAESRPDSVVVDLLETDFVDSSGLRALLICRRRTGDRGARYRLCVASGPVTRLLDVAGVAEYFDYVCAEGSDAVRGGQ